MVHAFIMVKTGAGESEQLLGPVRDLETVAEATRSGILSRDKRKSFVNLSRKRGYHLCLVEARNENFHLEVPEL